MPMASLPAGKVRVLIVDSDKETASALADNLRTNGDYDVQIVKSSFESGVVAHKFAPHALLISLMANGIDATEICKTIRSSEELQTIKIIALANRLNDSESAALLHKGFDGYVSNSDAGEVIKKIEEATAIVY